VKRKDFVRVIVRKFKTRLPADISPLQFKQAVDDALKRGIGLTWIPFMLKK